MIVGRALVILSGCKFSPCPILIIDGDWLSSHLSVKKGKLCEDGLDYLFFIFTPQCRDAHKSGHLIGPIFLSGSLMNLYPGGPQAEPFLKALYTRSC